MFGTGPTTPGNPVSDSFVSALYAAEPVFDPGLTAAIRQRQLGYLSQSTAVEAATVKARPFHTRLIGDVIGMASPLL